MLRTKKDVDKHVQQICEKIPSEVERNLKGFTIAKLYFNVGDFETARKYLAKYISVRENSAAAFKLNGHILESQKEKQKALKSYKKAFELDNSQKDVVLKICELMCELPLDPERARYWVEVAEKVHPNNSVVSQLRVKMAGADFENGGATGSSDVSSPETNREESSVLWSANGASRLDDLGQNHSTPRWMGGGEQGTPTRRFAPRPSPERLASHLKRLEDSHEHLLTTVLDTQRAMLEEIRQGNKIWKEVKEEVASLRQTMRERDQDLAKSASAAASAAVAAAESAKAAAISSHQRVEAASSTAAATAAANKESRDIKQLELELVELRAQCAQNTILHNAIVQLTGSSFHNAAAAAMVRSPMPAQLRPDMAAAAAMGIPPAGLLQMQQLASMQGFGDMFPVPSQPPVVPPPQQQQQQQPVQSNESIANLLLRQQQPPQQPPQQLPQVPKPVTPKVGLTPVSTPVETPAHSGNATPILQKPIAKPIVPPTNVVITSSEKIPSGSTIPAFTGSVTVPPQHRLGTTPTPSTPSSFRASEGTTGSPHVYQINLPQGVSPLTTSPFANQEGPAVPITTTSLLSSIPAPAYSAVTPDKSGSSPFALGRQRQASISSQKSVDGSHVEDEEHDPCPDFKPIIPLPEEVEVVTGEENEEVLFEDRSKLFRFIDNQWKERGVGQLKVLKHQETGKIRVLMRRDQTHKIAANHFVVIEPDMKLKKMPNNDKAVTWNANDFADEELKTEVFCAKFKTADQADNFKDVMDKAIETIRGGKSSGSVPQPSSKPVENLGSLAAFKPKAGSWECGGCFIRNEADKIQCPACQTAKPGHEEEVKAKEEAAKPKISFGAGGGFKFGGGTATTTASSGFSFGSPAPAASVPAATTTTASGFSFGSKPSTTTASTGFSFGTPTTSTATPTASTTTFGNFSFSSTPVVKPTDSDTTAAAPAKEETKPPSVFSSFSFKAATTTASPAVGGFSFTQQTPDLGGTSASTAVTINLGGGSKVTEVGGGGGSTELSFDGKGLKLNTEADAEPVAKQIENFKNMKTLTLSGNTVGIDAAKVIGRALEKHPEFEYAHWKDMFTGRMKTEIPPALEHLCNGIMKAKANLIELDLSDNAMGPVGLKGLVTFLKSPSCFTLQELKLNNTGCGVTGGKQLAETLLECHKEGSKVGKPLALKVFVLGRSRQENDGATALAKVFKIMGSLEEVIMPQNGIYHQGIAALTDAFALNPKLKILNLNDNTFTEKGAECMAKLLPNLPNLTYLNLGDCLLRTTGAKMIASALKTGHLHLEELYLDSNEIRTEGGLAIVDAIANKSKLKKLVIDSNQFGADGCAAILKKLNEIGKGHLISEISDDEEPDSDDDGDDDAEDEEETEEDEKEESTPKPVSAIFGGTPTSSSASKNLFGGSSGSSTPSTGIFGSSSSQTASPSIFGSKPSGGFGSDASKPTSIFGNASESPSIFGSSSGSKPSIFGGASSGGLFGKPVITSPDSTNAGKDLSESKNLSSFGALADKTDGYAFGAKKEGFTFAGAGSAVFGQKHSATKSGGGDEEEAGDDNHDPHFEPIIPLPELVQVTTGEEEEQAVFQHRAKLYRYSPETKEWKERGVGDMKILKHPTNNTFRVLLRREQIHKIACNHRITPEMELKPMMSSETAVCWFAMDYAEDEGKIEQFAVRFKHAETKDQFKAKFEECQAELRNTQQPKVTMAKHAEGESEDSEEEDDEEDDGNTMFIRKCELSEQNTDGSTKKLGRVVLKVVYDDEYYGAKVVAIPEDNTSSEDDDEYEELCNHLIAMHTNLNEEDAKTFTWSALDFATDSHQATYKTFTARFEREEDGQDFRDTFYEGKDLAEQSEIIEQPGGHEVDPNDMYYGEGGDFNQEA